MSGGTIIVPKATGATSRLGRAWEIAADLAIATAVIWALPLLFAATAALVALVRGVW